MFASIFYREKGSAVPSLVDNNVEFGQTEEAFQLFTAFDYELHCQVILHVCCGTAVDNSMYVMVLEVVTDL